MQASPYPIVELNSLSGEICEELGFQDFFPQGYIYSTYTRACLMFTGTSPHRLDPRIRLQPSINSFMPAASKDDGVDEDSDHEHHAVDQDLVKMGSMYMAMYLGSAAVVL
ncbi:hypothetical protein ACJX0J_011420, partial [Zea mays]